MLEQLRTLDKCRFLKYVGCLDMREDIHIHYCIGSGYAIPSPEGCAAVRRLARTEGILTDPVYTGKALAGFFQLLEQGAFDQDENILFVHTGGAGALFAVEMGIDISVHRQRGGSDLLG